MSNPQASPALVSINGNEYLVSPLTDRNIGEINNYIRSQAIKTARESFDPNDPPEVKELTLRIAIQEAAKVDWTETPGIITNPDYMMYVFWTALRKNHPELTRETFTQEVLEDPEAVGNLMDAFTLVQPFLGEGPEGNRKAARKPQAKKKVKK